MASIEKELKESEEIYRTLTEQSFLGISILQDDLIQYVNRQLANMFGYTVQEIMSWEKEGFLNIIHPDDKKIVAEQAKKKQSGDSDVINQYQFKGIKKNGDILWLEVFSKTITYKGKLADFVTIHNITDKKIVEQKIKESEKRYRSLFNNMNAGFAYHKVIVDENKKPIDYQYLEVNPAFEKLTGLKADQMIGKRVTEILPGTENDPADWIGKFGRVGLTGIPLIVEDYSEALDRWYKVSGYSPKKGYFAVTFTDITEQKKAEIIIKESEEKYRRLFNNAPFAIILFTIEGNILDCNDATELITGYSKQDLIGYNFRDFNFYIDEEDAKIEKRERQVKKGMKPAVREIMLSKKDGSKFYARSQIEFVKLNEETCIQSIIHDITEQKKVEKEISDLAKFPSENPNPVLRVDKEKIIYINKAGRMLFNLTQGDKIPQNLAIIITNVFDENISKIWEGEINAEYYSFNISPILEEGYVNIYGRNITEKKKSETALSLEKKFVDDILDSSMDTIFVFNPETGKAIRWNKTFSNVSGYSDEEIASLKAPNSYYSEEDLQVASEATKSLLAGGKAKLEMSLITKDGRKIPYEYTGTTLKNADGTVLIASVGRDLTERRDAESKLKESEAKFRGIFETIPDLFFQISSDTTILDYRGKIEELYVPPDEFLGKKLVNILPEDIAELSKNSIRKTLETHEPQIIEYNMNISGENRYYEARHLYFPEDSVLIFIRDITIRRKAEKKLLTSENRYREAFDQANFYKDLFTHDINNILQVVNSSAELITYQLGDSEKSKDIAHIAGIIKKQVDRGSKLINNVRTLSQIEEEQIPTKTIEISQFLTNSIDFVEKAYEERKIKISVDGLNRKHRINANELIQDVFENILINSIKYNENRNVEIFIRLSKMKIDKKSHFKIEFIDNGIGVPDERKKAIFLSGNRELKGSKGMGLGLSLVSKIIQMFNGKIWVEDKVKGDYTRGSNFIIVLPETE